MCQMQNHMWESASNEMYYELRNQIDPMLDKTLSDTKNTCIYDWRVPSKCRQTGYTNILVQYRKAPQ